MRNLAPLMLVLCIALGGCTTGYGEKLDLALVESFKLQQVTVSVPEDATFWWGDGERAYAASIGRSVGESEALGKTPQGRAFLRSLAAQRIKAAFDRELAGRLNGTRPVRIEVTMQDIYVSSPMQQVLLGGDYHMKASAKLVDARTGEVIVANPNLRVQAPAGSGVLGMAIDRATAEPIDRLATNLADSYRGWLLPSNEPPPRS
jgi:hypothetical protein